MATKQPEHYRTFATLTPALKERVLAEAETDGTNMTDVIVAKLAARFSVPFVPSGRPPGKPTNPDQLDVILRMPVALYTKIVKDSWAHVPRKPITRIVVETLEAAYEGAAV